MGAVLVPAALRQLWLNGCANAAKANPDTKLRAAGQTLAINGADVQYLRQIMTKEPACSRVIMWQSEQEQDGLLEYRAAGESDKQQVQATDWQFRTYDGALLYLHRVQLTGLSADTVYEYRVGSMGAFTDWCYMSTANGTAFKVLLFPDSQCAGDYRVWTQVAQTAWRLNPDARFFVNLGDLVDNGQQYAQWQAWLSGADGLLEQIPFAPVCGNHEDYDLNWQMSEPDTYLQMFHLPENGVAGHSGLFYSYDAGAVHFVVLDSQQSELADFKPELFKLEYTWLEQDLASTKQKWKVVMLHKHLLDYMNHTGITEIGKWFMPLFDQYGVDIVFTAHLHTYHRTRALYQGKAAQMGGTVYISAGRAGDMAWPGYFPAQSGIDIEECGELTEPNYLVLHATETALDVECCLLDGRVADRLHLEK